MFNPIFPIRPQLLLAPLTASFVLGLFGSLPASAQTIIFGDRYPLQVVPNSRRDSYVNQSPLINGFPTRSPITNPSPMRSPFDNPQNFPPRAKPSPYFYDDYYPAPRHHGQRRVTNRRPSRSGTTILINPTNPTVVIPGGYGRQYPYPHRYPHGSSVYYGSPRGFQIQIGY